jgi:beta-glucosidase
MLDAFVAAGIEVTYSAGYEPDRAEPDPRLIADAVAIARDADVAIVMVGLPGISESEGFDRTTLSLPRQHDELVSAVAAVNTRTVVVLSNGSPVLMPWHRDVAAILECYLGGQASGGAAVDALLGDVEPAGRLAETFPVAQEDVASDPFFPGNFRQVEYREGLFVGYRHATSAGVRPLFPFGHGLGYGHTVWRSAAVSRSGGSHPGTLTVTVEVENTGDRPTSEVVQVYSRDLTGVVLRPRRELVGFAKVALAVGERRTVAIQLEARSFAFWDVRAGDWRIPGGRFDLEIARSSEQVELTVPITVEGDVDDSAEPPTSPAIARTDAEFERRLGYPIPAPAPARPFTRDSTIGDLAVTGFGRLFRAVMRKAVSLPDSALSDPTTMAMIERSTDELPLRGIVQLSGGRSSWAFVDSVILLANRKPARAVVNLLRRSGGR